MVLNLEDAKNSKIMVSDFICDQDYSCFIRGFHVNNVNPLNAFELHLKCHMLKSSLNTIKMHLKCHMLKFSDTLYLLTLLTNAIAEANNVDPVQQ